MHPKPTLTTLPTLNPKFYTLSTIQTCGISSSALAERMLSSLLLIWPPVLLARNSPPSLSANLQPGERIEL